MKRLISILLVLISGCIPNQKDFIKKESRKGYEGFVNNSSFQVICKTDLIQSYYHAESRDELINACRKHLVLTLSKFKIAYDLNMEDAYIIKRKKPSDIYTEDFVYNVKIKTPIRGVNQIEMEISDEQINQLMTLYSDFLPGKIVQEWNDGETLYVLYQISNPGLLNRVKNTNLPFGLLY